MGARRRDAAFRQEDPAFAAALGQRLDLAVGALDREVLDAYGTYLQIDGRRTPAWLIVDGADATAEAMLGLSAYVRASGSSSARSALTEFSEGVAALSAGEARSWPFGGAVLPWGLAHLASKHFKVFDPWLLTSGGPDNGRLPTRVDGTQIAYGVDSRVQSLLATAQVSGSTGPRRLAGMTAAWFFGANPADTQAYDPSSGGQGHGTALLRNAGPGADTTSVSVAGTDRARVEEHTRTGQLVSAGWASGRVVPVAVPAGGYSIVRR